MPELPEVEVLRRSLEPRLVGRELAGAWSGGRRLREPVPAVALAELLGRCIVALRRRAKYLLVDFSGGVTVAFHLGMSGRLTLEPAGAPRHRHEHVALALAGGERLRLVDPRRFGLVLVLPGAGLEGDRHFRHLGPEPLAEGFSGGTLQHAASGRRGPVKTLLMDASVVAGVGNIYASEALHRAGIHPRRSVGRIGVERWRRLAAAVREVLAAAIEQGGTTLADFVDGAGQPGDFRVSLAVYDRAGEPCLRAGCQGCVRRILQANRSTYFCPRCQR
jgi:formamidopyrimidine-DNA glycosylase